MAVVVAAPGGTTRGAIRRRVGQLSGQYQQLIATSAGDTTTIIDDNNLAISTKVIVNRMIVVVTGHASNISLVRRVSANDRLATSLTLSTALPQPTAAGDIFELWSSAGQGVTPMEVNEHINSAILDAGEIATIGAYATATTFDVTAPTLSIDPTFQYITGAQWQDWNGVWKDVPPANLDIDAVSRTVTVQFHSMLLASGCQVRLRGYKRSGALTADTDETAVPAEWLAYQVASTVLLAAANRVNDHRRDDFLTRSQFLGNEARNLRSQTPTRTQGGRRVRV